MAGSQVVASASRPGAGYEGGWMLKSESSGRLELKLYRSMDFGLAGFVFRFIEVRAKV